MKAKRVKQFIFLSAYPAFKASDERNLLAAGPDCTEIAHINFNEAGDS